MTLSDLVVVLLRRWWLVALLLAVTAAGVWQTYAGQEVRYQAASTVVLRLQSEGDVPVDRRAPSGQVLAAVLQRDEVRSRITPSTGPTQYTVSSGLDPAGTLLRVVATGQSRDDALRVVHDVLDEVAAQVREREAVTGVRTGDQATVQQLSRPLDAEPVPMSDVPGLLEGYRAQGIVLVSTPPAPITPFPPASSTIRYLEELLETSTLVAQLESDHDTTVELVWDRRDVVPIFYLSATSVTPEEADAVLRRLQGAVEGILQNLHDDAGVPEGARTIATPLVDDPVVEPQIPQVSRALAAVAGLGLFATVSLTLLLDAALASRAVRRQPDGLEHADRAEEDRADDSLPDGLNGDASDAPEPDDPPSGSIPYGVPPRRPVQVPAPRFRHVDEGVSWTMGLGPPAGGVHTGGASLHPRTRP